MKQEAESGRPGAEAERCAPEATPCPSEPGSAGSEAGTGAPRPVSASEYCRLAGIRMSGEELDAWCDRNGLLAKALGRVGRDGSPGYDPRTAMHFRAIWMDAETKWKEAQNADLNS